MIPAVLARDTYPSRPSSFAMGCGPCDALWRGEPKSHCFLCDRPGVPTPHLTLLPSGPRDPNEPMPRL
jgi:hypothetical protein